MKKLYKFFARIWTASIRRQLILGIILVHAVLMTIFVFDLVERQRDFLHTQSVQQAKSLSETLAVNSTSWVLANDVIGLEEVMDAQRKYPDLRSAMVLDIRGRILAHTEVDKVGLYLKDLISAKLLTSNKEKVVLINNANIIDVASQITINGELIGWARVNLAQDKNSKSLQIITRDGVLYTVTAIVIGALFAFFMAKGITQGLKQIVDVAEGVKYGNQTLRAPVDRQDEIGKLGEDFNLMLDTIEVTKRDLQAIMDNSPTVIYVKNIEGEFTFVNKQFEKLFHLKKEDVVGKVLHDIFPKNIADEMRRNDLDIIETGRPLESEEAAPQEDGMHTYASIKFPLFDDQNKIYAVCGISTDKTERLKMESDKSVLEAQLYHSQKMQAIGQLTGGVAHDFNNLLAIVLGYAEISLDVYGKENDELKGYLDEIYKAGSRGQELIQQMMLYSRKEQNETDLSPLKVATVIEETVGMLKSTFPTSIHIKTAIEKNVPYVQANASLVSQVLMNLCINAKHGMGEEGVLLITLGLKHFSNNICHSCAEQYSGSFVVISVKDNGQGIENNILDRIFEPFFTSKNIGEGTGMGLSVVHGIVHKLGGHIIVNSTVGEGTEFEILLPVTTDKKEVESRELKTEEVLYDFSALRIMVVDDEPAVAGFIETALKRVNARVDVFTDSKQALECFKSKSDQIDLVITDQTMPNLSGMELSEILFSIRKDIAIILCTGYSSEVTEESAMKLGIKAFVSKPVKADKIYRLINSLM